MLLRRRPPTPVNVTPVAYNSIMLGTPIRVVWIDAHHVSTSWVPVHAISTTVCKVVSTGMFLFATDQQVFYAADLATNDGDAAANAVSAIPVGCIVSVEQLGDPHG